MQIYASSPSSFQLMFAALATVINPRGLGRYLLATMKFRLIIENLIGLREEVRLRYVALISGGRYKCKKKCPRSSMNDNSNVLEKV